MSQPVDDRADYCYRHRNRQSFVLCQRCGRTICGECQTPGPVGVICPECMKEQRASAPRTKPAFVTRLKRASPSTPVVTYGIIAVCAVIFVLQNLPVIGNYVSSALLYAPYYSFPGTFEPWRMITTIFAHANILHIALNMYTLWVMGRILEPLLGRIRYLVLFFLSGLAGSVGVLLIASPFTAVVGASGAIFGMFGAFFVIQRRLGGNATQILVLILVNLVIGFIPAFGISWQAHVGGLIGGAIVGLIYTETRPLSRRPLQVGLLCALAVVLIVISCKNLFIL